MYSFTQLEGRNIILIPLELDHVLPLFESAQNPEIWMNYPISITTEEDMRKFILKATEARDRKDQYPYAVFDKDLNKFVGSTRYLRLLNSKIYAKWKETRESLEKTARKQDCL